VWDGWFAQTESVASTVPWMVTVGNHEMEKWYSANGYGGLLSRFDFLGNGPSNAPTVYSYTYGNVAVLALDVNDVSYEIPANLFYTGANGGTQASWIAQTVAKYRKDPSIDFIVAFFHQCAYCSCSVHASEGGARQFWAPIFDKFDIDLVINGHNHIYERTDPLRGGAATKAAPIGSTIDPTKSGTTYVNCGAGGTSLYSFPVADSYEGNLSSIDAVPTYVNSPGGVQTKETVSWSRVRYTGYILLVVDSEPAARSGRPSKLTIRAINEFGTEIDNFVLSRTSR
jgi:Calcineurin-like phosphoesterase